MSSPSKNIFWLALSRVFAAVLVLLAYRSLLRYLGPHGFGQYQFVLSYVTIFGVIIDFGLQQYIIKKISERREDAKRYFHNFLATEVLLIVIIYALIAGIAQFIHAEPVVVHAIMIAGLGVVITGLTYPFLSVMSAHYDLRRVAVLNFMSSLINVGTIAAVIYFRKYIVLLAAQQIFSSAMMLTAYYYLVRRHIPRPDILGAFRLLDRALIKKMFIAAFPFALLVGFSTLYNRLDVVLITKMLGYTQTGYYTAAYRFFDFIGFFPAVVSVSLYPLFATLMAERKIGEVRATLEKYLRFLLAIALPMGVGGMLLARPLVSFFAGSQYPDTVAVLAILVWAPAILFIYIVANTLVISQLTKFAVMITGANVIVNLVGNIILLPIIGIRGAAIMTVVSEAIQGLFYFYFIYRKITPFRFWGFIWRPVLASAVMGAALWWIGRDSLVVPLVAGSVVYFLALGLFGFFRKDDLVFLKNFIRPQAAV